MESNQSSPAKLTFNVKEPFSDVFSQKPVFHDFAFQDSSPRLVTYLPIDHGH
jgi:hypothetical protein